MLRGRLARIYATRTMHKDGRSAEEVDTTGQYVAGVARRVEPAHEHSRQVTRGDRQVSLWRSLLTLYDVSLRVKKPYLSYH